jgi:hypothetical protein
VLAHRQRVYHLCEARYAVANIEKSRLKVATFADANDPFELSVFFSRDPAQRRRLRHSISTMLLNGLELSALAKIGLIPPFGAIMATNIRGSRSASTFRKRFYCLFDISLSALLFLRLSYLISLISFSEQSMPVGHMNGNNV